MVKFRPQFIEAVHDLKSLLDEQMLSTNEETYRLIEAVSQRGEWFHDANRQMWLKTTRQFNRSGFLTRLGDVIESLEILGPSNPQQTKRKDTRWIE